MEKYKALIGKKIQVMMFQDVLDSYVITKIEPSNEVDKTGKADQIYKCHVQWSDKSTIGYRYPYMNFADYDLDALIKDGLAHSPILAGNYFKVVE